jgi:hypothetical protein
MAITPATVFSAEMTKLTGNTGGSLQQLIEGYIHGKEYAFVATITLAAQASGVVVGVARIPVPFTPISFTLITDTSLGSSTVALGNAADGNSAIYKAAATFTATDTPTGYGKAATLGVPVLSGIDCLTGLPTTYGNAGNGGGGYEDIILTVGAATMPASGTLRVITRYITGA